MIQKSLLLAASVVLLSPASALGDVDPNAGMLRYPDVSKSHIVFSYANDLWIVPTDGGMASPLASPRGQEVFPKFSPDGASIAFMGNYEGNRDLYTIGVSGGVPERVTHHPATEVLCDWSPDGDLVFSTNGQSGLGRLQKLFRVDAAGGLPDAIPVPYGANGVISPDGEWLAYTPHSRDNRTWKRYRGGMASDIWLFNLNTMESRRVTDWEGTDSLPMWHGAMLYYLSDAGPSHRLNIWSYDPRTGDHTQLTEFDEYDVKWPSVGPGANNQGEIILQNGPSLRVLDLSTNAMRDVEVTIPGDRPTLRQKVVDASEHLQGAGISSTGKRAVMAARGDVWTSPVEKGVPRNLTRTDGVAERAPAWSPDGRWIAYMSDATGEYELYVTQSDGKGDTTQITSDGNAFKYIPIWSPDSKMIAFSDKAGRLLLVTLETKDVNEIDTDPWAEGPTTVNWSHDSRWMAYHRPHEETGLHSIWLYDVEAGVRHQVTSDMFDDTLPVFDRKGDHLYFASSRVFSPSYSDLPGDTTFIYENGEVVLAVPLREDMSSPWAPELEEEEWDEEDPDADDDEGEGEEEEAEDDDADDDEDDEDEDEGEVATIADDGISGTWEGTAETPDGPMDFSLFIRVDADGSVNGSLSAGPFSGDVTGTYDKDSNALHLVATVPGGPEIVFDLVLEGTRLHGDAVADGMAVDIDAGRTASLAEGDDEDEDADEEEARERVEIAIDGFERRAIRLPIPTGVYRQLAVNNKNQLVYSRDGAGVKLFDIDDDKKEEKSVAAGVAGFDISADGKKLLVTSGTKLSIQDASAGSTGKGVVMDNMRKSIDPRTEWRQIFDDAWRMHRDFFYVANMHGVDWDAVREQYGAMIDDCVSREDVSFVIGEMIAELNVGHAYYFGGDVEDEPSMDVGMLGVDFESSDAGYRIARIHEGASWDDDARGPLSQPGVDVKEGDFLLAVNGMPLESSLDPWSAFIGTQGHETVLTVSENEQLGDDDDREVIVKPISFQREMSLRYRSRIEANRAYVDQRSSGRVGYIYVPNTGTDGQNDLFRQFFGQSGKDALIIDERWNGGGQIPTRFIELLNRPRTNYWARRDGKDWPWPPDSHQGPKCMLINGLAGSGGDMFPALFRQAGLGKLIGTRTWGGLVGLSGNPALIDGGYTAVPTFGYYETDGTWGIEGHGVDPDIEVLDDPGKMVSGRDPQLDVAVDLMIEEIENNPYVPPERPAAPDRTGMGIADDDK